MASKDAPPVPVKEKILSTGASALQKFDPVTKICQTVCGIHAYAHDASRQVVAHHFCSHVSGDMRQCIIYDSNKADAKLIGIEYIISRKLFETLPMEERKYWHSHEFEVKSGMLVAPGIPMPLELQEMQEIVGTFGKTWHTWQVDRGDPLPFGPPQLMMSFTADGQIDEAKLKKAHDELGYDTAEIRRKREEKIKFPESMPEGSDHPWQTGKSWQTQMEQGPFKKLG